MQQDRADGATTAEVVERMTSRVANSLVIAAGIIGIGIYAAGGVSQPAQYEAVATPDGRVVRVNTSNGSIVSCDSTHCTLIFRRGDDLERPEEGEGAPQPGTPQPGAQQPALPAPAAAPGASATQGAPAQQPAAGQAPATGTAPAASTGQPQSQPQR